MHIRTGLYRGECSVTVIYVCLCQFEVYAVDVAMTTGEGKPREQDSRTTIFKRAVDRNYHLKMRGARALYSEVR